MRLLLLLIAPLILEVSIVLLIEPRSEFESVYFTNLLHLLAYQPAAMTHSQPPGWLPVRGRHYRGVNMEQQPASHWKLQIGAERGSLSLSYKKLQGKTMSIM